jgi:hypothetical protein
MDTALDIPSREPAPHITIIAPEVTVRAHHGGAKLSIAAFVFCLIALLASAIAISVIFTEADGVHIWAVVMLGAAIITILMSLILAPFLKAVRSQR